MDNILQRSDPYGLIIADSSADGLYFYADNGDWLWTSDVISPYYYNIMAGTWGPLP